MKFHPAFTGFLGYHVASILALITSPDLASWARSGIAFCAACAIPIFIGLILETSGLKLGKTGDEVVHRKLVLPGLFLSVVSVVLVLACLWPWALLGFAIASAGYIYFFFHTHYREDCEERKEEPDVTPAERSSR